MKHLIHFFTFSIVATMSIFVLGICSVKAEEIIDLNYDSETVTNLLNGKNFNYYLEEVMEIVNQYENDGFVFYVSVESWDRGVKIINIEVLKFNSYDDFSFYYNNTGMAYSISNFNLYEFKTSFWTDESDSWNESHLNNLKTAMTDYTNKFTLKTGTARSSPLISFNVKDSKADYSAFGKDFLYYATSVVTPSYSFTGKYSIGDQVIEVTDMIPSYYNYRVRENKELKKEFSYNNDFTNPVKSIDFYFNNDYLTKNINFEFNFFDNIDYNSCSWCSTYSEIDSFDSAILLKNENGTYKWVKSNSYNGGFVDYDGETIPKNVDGTGYSLTGRFIFNFQDYSIDDIVMVRISINLTMAYDFSYQYKDDSSLTSIDIDEYYHYMLSSTGERLNRIDSHKTKYTILTTTENNLKNDLIVEYINTNKYLYVEYFDTSTHSYIEKGSILAYDYSIMNGRDIEKFTYSIGKSNARGLYLMNYLYNRENKNLDSKYYFYIPTDVYYSYTDFLDESIFYDHTGNINEGISSNPTYETDNKFFSDNFRPIYNFLDDMQETSLFFNNGFEKIYNSIPTIIRAFFEVVTHLLCIFIFMKIVGYE